MQAALAGAAVETQEQQLQEVLGFAKAMAEALMEQEASDTALTVVLAGDLNVGLPGTYVVATAWVCTATATATAIHSHTPYTATRTATHSHTHSYTHSDPRIAHTATHTAIHRQPHHTHTHTHTSPPPQAP